MFCKVVFDVPLDRDFDYAVPLQWQDKIRPGVRVTAPFGKQLTTGLVTEVSDTTALDSHIQIKEIACVLDEKPLFGTDLFPLAKFMKQTWGGPIGQILFALVPPQAFFKLGPVSALPDMKFHTPAFALTSQQKDALCILQNYLNNGFYAALLSGPASCGKTEVALRLAEQVLRGFGQALITLPDVLAAQNFTKVLEKRFGTEYVFCWHSKMLLSQKKKIFSLVSNGVPCLIVSARSGALLPFKNLRLAVMLEEENDNYKQEENKPYFHLRDLLSLRAQQHEALFLPISDTPSLEILQQIKTGKTQEITFTQSVTAKAQNPQYKVTEKKGQYSPLFSDFLVQELKQNFQAKQASLIILNRRGYSNAYYCLNCGTYAKCKGCGAILAREKSGEGEDYLICKKCGHKEPLEQTCPQCQNKIFKSRGGGTQKIVTELGKLFPDMKVLRLDSDTLKNKSGQGYLVRKALDEGQADAVVGTRQALEAALSPRITLAAIADADLELDSPDFRASEKFGQLLFKLRNRLATRNNGRLVIQASSPDIYPFEGLSGAYKICAEEELLARESFLYPPFVKMVKVLVRSKDQTLLQAETARLMSQAAVHAKETLGPIRTGKKTDTLKKQYVLFKTSAEQYAALVELLDRLKPSKKTDLKVVADPYDFY